MLERLNCVKEFIDSYAVAKMKSKKSNVGNIIFAESDLQQQLLLKLSQSLTFSLTLWIAMGCFGMEIKITL